MRNLETLDLRWNKRPYHLKSTHWLWRSRWPQPGSLDLLARLISIFSNFIDWRYALIWPPLAPNLILLQTTSTVKVGGGCAFVTHFIPWTLCSQFSSFGLNGCVIQCFWNVCLEPKINVIVIINYRCPILFLYLKNTPTSLFYYFYILNHKNNV